MAGFGMKKQGRSISKPVKKSHAKKVKKSKPKLVVEPIVKEQLTSGEVKNIVADSLQRIYGEYGQELDRLNADNFAVEITKYLRHGLTSEGQEQPPKLREKSLSVPLCKECKAL